MCSCFFKPSKPVFYSNHFNTALNMRHSVLSYHYLWTLWSNELNNMDKKTQHSQNWFIQTHFAHPVYCKHFWLFFPKHFHVTDSYVDTSHSPSQHLQMWSLLTGNAIHPRNDHLRTDEMIQITHGPKAVRGCCSRAPFRQLLEAERNIHPSLSATAASRSIAARSWTWFISMFGCNVHQQPVQPFGRNNGAPFRIPDELMRTTMKPIAFVQLRSWSMKFISQRVRVLIVWVHLILLVGKRRRNEFTIWR